MLITKEEYEDRTRNRKPEVSYYGLVSWYEDYYIQGNLVRFSGLDHSGKVEMIDLWDTDMAFMGEDS